MSKDKNDEADTADEQPRLVVGIGSSAGGIPALRPLLAQLPTGVPVAYVLLQHTDPTRTAELCRVLCADDQVPLQVAQDGDVLRAGQAYLMPTDSECAFREGRIQLKPAVTPDGARHSIDHLFTELAEAYQENTVGVVLSGSGMDGVQGMRAIRAASGVTIAQDPASAEYPSMPEAVISAGLADLILTIEQIAAEIPRLLEWRDAEVSSLENAEADSLKPVLRMVQRRTGFDFNLYKEGTIKRRLARRMMVNRCSTLDEYRRLLVGSEAEAEVLVQDLLISVTSFFRDPNTFRSLKKLLGALVEESATGDAIRVWVAGCASGEEAYSIAMVLAELLGERIGRVKVQIFATDIDTRAIKEARKALYPFESLRTLPETFIEKYFDTWDGLFRLRRDLRDMVVFAEHDLAQDPPFTRLDLVSCRNTLIYFKRPLQEQLLNSFHYALKPGGLLLLGESESADRITNMFERADKGIKIYRRVASEAIRPAQAYRTPLRRVAGNGEPAQPPAQSAQKRMQRLLVDHYAPPSVLVNAQQNIVYVHGDISRYVRLPQGEVNINLVEMAITGELRVELRLVMNKAVRDSARVRSHSLALPGTQPPRQLTLVAMPGDDGHVLVVFEESDAPQTVNRNAVPTDTNTRERIVELEQEISGTREHLHSNIEELEAANEELQSTNEEFQSTTEELQSALEEHQTTNEELQSTNEELNTVNDELNIKTEALEATNADMQSILDNVATAIIVLDRHLCITRYSAASKAIFDLTPTIIGRPFLNLGSAMDLGLLAPSIREAARERHSIDTTLAIGERQFAVCVVPRVDHAEALSSLIVVFTEETERLRVQENVRLLATVVRDANDAIFVRDMDGTIMTWNAAAEDMFGYTQDEAVGQPLDALLPETLQKQVRNLETRLRAGGIDASADEDAVMQLRSGVTRAVGLKSSLLLDERDEPFAISTIARDVTRQQEEREAVRAAKEAIEQNMLTKDRFLAAASHDLRQPLQSLSYYLASADASMDESRWRDLHHKMAISLSAMRNLLNALLDISRLDAGRIEPHMEVFCMQRVFDEVAAQVADETAQSAGVTLRIVPCSAFVRSDRALLGEMLSNLMVNALKYTTEGRVLVGCRRRGDQLRIEVHDSGPGIAPEYQKIIFEEFVRLPEARDSERHGLGLGLSIVSRLSELLDHPLNVRSELGRGACFSMDLPRASASDETSVVSSPVATESASGRVLLVDDDEAVLDGGNVYLSLKGFTVDAAVNAQDALRLAQSDPPDIVVIDYRLQDEDGLQVLQQIREALGKPQLPAIIVTGESQAALEDQIREAGARLMLKPMDTGEFVRLLRQMMAEHYDNPVTSS